MKHAINTIEGVHGHIIEVFANEPCVIVDKCAIYRIQQGLSNNLSEST